MSEVGGRWQAQTALGKLTLPEGVCHEGEVTVLIRPDAAKLDPKGLSDPSDLVVDGVLVERSFRGEHTRIVVRANETTLEFKVDSAVVLPPTGSTIRLWLHPDAIMCLPADDGGAM